MKIKQIKETHLNCFILHGSYKFQHEPVPGLAPLGCSSLAVPGHMTRKLQSSILAESLWSPNRTTHITHICKEFLMHLSCQSPIYCNIKIYTIMLLLQLKMIVIYHHTMIIVQTQNDCAIPSHLLFKLKMTVLYNHTYCSNSKWL